MLKSTIAHLTTPRDEREDGFTLIEILVVIIIIGILAAVAIPIFLNQQKTARDSATTQDVRNLASNVETGLVADPDAASFNLVETLEGDEQAGDGTEAVLTVGDAAPITVSKTEGTVLTISGSGGEYTIEGYNENGREYVSGSALEYNNAAGGLQN